MSEICKPGRTYRICWARGVDINLIKELQSNLSQQSKALVEISTQTMKITLHFKSGVGFRFVPRRYVDGAWAELYPHETLVKSVTDEMLVSTESVESALVNQMMLQFRSSMEGYYDSRFPAVDQVLAAISSDPWTHILNDNYYVYYLSDIEEDPEWDGGYEVYCEGGKLLVPYMETSKTMLSGDPDYMLLAQHATFVPDNPVGHYAGHWLDKVRDRLSSLFRFSWLMPE